MKNQKGFIQIPLLIAIIAGVLVLGGAGYFGVKQYQTYRAQIIEKEKLAQESQQQKDSEVEKLKQEVEALKKQKPEVIKQTIIKEAPTIKAGTDNTSIIKEWRPRVAFIDCKVVFEGNNMGEQSGSGYILGSDTQNGDVIILTNNHVIDVAIHNLYGEPMNITATPTSCNIKVPGDSQFVTVYKENSPFSGSKEEDFGLITIKNPTSYMKTIIQNLWDGNCKNKAELGEKILILGYPGIGDQNDVTVTDGIISGYDGHYYITSAKIEHGNSGGIAVSLKNNCYLGIPTFVVTGELESLARILNINTIFPN